MKSQREALFEGGLPNNTERVVQKNIFISYGLIIGRFQPFHNGHLALIKRVLSECDKVIILIGSYRQARSIRNPFTYEERHHMIFDSLSQEEKKQISFAPIRDHLYNDTAWLCEVQIAVDELTEGSTNITLYGHNRDFSSYYLSMFPQWKFQEVGLLEDDISGSEIRKILFELNNI